MILLAIDPGNEQSAWVRYSTKERRLLNFGKQPNAEVLEVVESHAADSPSYTPQSPLAIEMIASYGMPVGAEVFDTCRWIGRLEQVWMTNYYGLGAQLVYRRDVKLHLCGQARAKDANIRAALMDLFGPGKERAIGTKKTPGPLYGVTADVWSALAVAVTVSTNSQQPAISAGVQP